ncbi:hypothetical protein AJ78_06514 [Emergomyces pasteurianus Ep9510]|uniref:Zn(2)-C6 fungal-type domain-containing protein n=1 Tax=Emergomyces pasteurianus Ep9510 TaxID=1447872 RepID=A0A1J9PA79_9EURO|nr:hypothetical protein AJ78_06514 [Emergomyces pasteurianus Ep9510]
MQGGLVARRTQFSSCDRCRRLRVRCDALNGANAGGNLSASCTRCLKRHQNCTFEWMNGLDRHGTREPPLGRHQIRRHRSVNSTASNISSPPNGGTSSAPAPVETASQMSVNSACSNDDRVPNELRYISVADTISPMGSPLDGLSLFDVRWLQRIYIEGFDTIFGSWMSKHGCPFLSGAVLGDDHNSIADVCGRLDQWMREMSQYDPAISLNGGFRERTTEDTLADESLRNTIAAFSVRWLSINSRESQSDICVQRIVHALWRHTRRDMLRVINRPSYRSMLALFLFALTPVPTGISEDEEADGISGQACIHAALQQIQMLRARQRSLLFNGTNVSRPMKSKIIPSIPDAIGATDFITAENIAYWAALTFDTSASLTLNCRSLLSSGLFGFEAELPWRLVRAGATIFQKNMQGCPANSIYNMTDERANQIIASGSAWKLLVWKLTAVFKEALRDGHDEPEVTRAYTLVVEAIQQFNEIYRGPLEACQRRMPFLGQQTKFRWYSLMLHYHLSILLLINTIETTDRLDLLVNLEEAYADAENVIINTLVFGLHNTITVGIKMQSCSSDPVGLTETSVTVPLISLDPYQHHIVAAVQLVQKAVDRDLAFRKITDTAHASLRLVLEKTLVHLPQSSKSVKAAVDAFPWKESNHLIKHQPTPYSFLPAQYVE